jgi:hypothetical protein
VNIWKSWSARALESCVKSNKSSFPF